MELIGKVLQGGYWLKIKKKEGRLMYSQECYDVPSQTLKLSRVSVYLGLALYSITFWVFVVWVAL